MHRDPSQFEEEEGQLSVDVYQNDEELVIQSTVAGIDMNDLEVLVQSDMIIIKGKRYPPEVVEPDRYIYRECYWGPFSRTIILPQNVDTEHINAALKNGILTIRLPKSKKSPYQKVEVKIEK